MTIHQCPKCDLRFSWNTELDDHCWHDHPEFRHEYPAQALPEEPVEQHAAATATEAEPYHVNTGSFFGWLQPSHEPETPPHRNPG
ncbi:MAG TPA: hypothetical protein VGH30_00220 [Jatrophihabitantaceae bacterium]|jgi:hypothetical protein